jgi:hypothetical protein
VSEEKRRFSRIKFDVPAELTFNEKTYPVNTIYNLSVGGGLFPILEIFQDGTECKVNIPLERETRSISVEVYGEIIRHTADLVTVKFTRIDPESLYHLQNIIRYNAPDSDKIEEEIKEHPGLI